jgi:penicillin-binding protein 1A
MDETREAMVRGRQLDGFGTGEAARRQATYRADLEVVLAKQRSKRRLLISLGVGATLGTLGLVLFAGWVALFGDMPKINSKDEVWTANRAPSLEIVDRAGTTLALRGPRYGRRVSVDDLPAHVLQAFLAVEDARFFEHGGVDIWAVGRAVVENITAGRTVQGASTITQQLVKNVYLTPDQTFKRKLQEMVLAFQIDRSLTKSEILEVYLNRIYFGQNAYGLDAAAWRFFSKRAWDLTLPEAAMLAGLPKAPGRLATNIISEAAYSRRAVVLGRMVSAGFITRRQASEAASTPIVVNRTPDPVEGELGYAINLAGEEMAGLGAEVSPDRVARITIDPRMQAAAVAAVQSVLDRAGSGAGVSQAALVAMDRQGRILAIVGGKSFSQSQFNRATQARRQPGSTFKPFVYAAALEAGMSPSTVRVDRPVRFGNWRPRNFGGGYSGAMTLNSALTRSINTIAVTIASEVGVDKLLQVVRRLGISSELPRNLTIALGSGDVTLLEMTRAYATLANDGVRVDPFLIEQVDNTRGGIAYRRETEKPVQVYEPLKARQMTAMLANVVAFGTGVRGQLADGREAAAKTGTSQNHRDAWYVGYTADIICGVWIGNDDGTSMRGVTGGTVPAEIWRTFMNEAHAGMPLSPLPTLDDLARPSNTTIAGFYQSLADMLGAAAGSELEPVAIRRPQATSVPSVTLAASPANPAAAQRTSSATPAKQAATVVAR